MGLLIGASPMFWVTRPDPPTVEAETIAPEDFIRVIKYLRETIATTTPRQRSLPYERAVRDMAIIRLTYATGCRVGEIARLQISDLDLGRQTITVQATVSKSKKKREVYFGRQAANSLQLWLQIRPTIGNRVFVGTRGNGWSQKPITGAGIYRAWQDWQAKTGVGPYKFHQIRHSHVTHSLNNGIPVHHISRQAGQMPLGVGRL